MKILAFGDTHGSPAALDALKKKAPKADVLVCIGDFTFFERDAEKNLADIAALGKPVLIIHGNHENEELLKGIEKKHKNLINLHKRVVSFGKIRFIGYGGGGFAKRDPRFEAFSSKVGKVLEKGDIAILVTHGPPHNTKLDHMYFLPDPHVGCKSRREFIERTSQVRLALSGHIHDTFGATDKIGKAMLINPGPKGKLIEIK